MKYLLTGLMGWACGLFVIGLLTTAVALAWRLISTIWNFIV